MDINELIRERNMTKYQLSKNSDVPYATLSDICSGKTSITKCSVETVYKLSRELNVTMEVLVESQFEKRPAFELFKSNVCHRVKALGDIDFLIETIEKDDIRKYHQRKWYAESFYLLAMLDYISRLNNVPICEEYNDLRKQKLRDTLYPASVITVSIAAKDNKLKEVAVKESIPEFIRFNIVESEVRNVN